MEIKEGEDISFDELLLKLKVTEENYLIAIRLSVTPNTPTVFLKRNPNELQINIITVSYTHLTLPTKLEV